MKLTFKIFSVAVQTLLFILLPFVVFTLITSKTSVVGIQSFVVLSGSMSPKFPTGSIVYARKMAYYKNYDVITFKNNSGQIVTHRITKVINEKNNYIKYQTKGDANKTIDKSPVSQKDIIGKIVFFIPLAGYLVNSLNTPIGIGVFIIFPTTMFIVFELWNIKKEIEKQMENKFRQQMKTITINTS